MSALISAHTVEAWPASLRTTRSRPSTRRSGVDLLLRDLRASPIRAVVARGRRGGWCTFGPNVLRATRRPALAARAGRVSSSHPLALLLWAAAALAWVAGIVPVAIAIVVVIFLNAAFAFVQEMQAERAVEALAGYLPASAKVLRDGREQVDRGRAARARRRAGDRGGRPHLRRRATARRAAIEVDLSTLTGESRAGVPLGRARSTRACRCCRRASWSSPARAAPAGGRARWCSRPACRRSSGASRRCPQRVERDESPLETQVRRVAWLIALIAVVTGVAFVPIAVLGAGLPVSDAVVFAVGLLVGNVPEGLLPVITLALAVGVRELVAPRRGRQAAERGRDARLDERDLHRQDRHADREPDARHRDLDGAAGARPRGRRWTPPRAATRRSARRRDGGLQQRALATPAASRRATRPSWRCSTPPRGSARHRPARTGARPPPPVPLRSGAQADVDGRRARRRRCGSTPRARRRRSCPLHDVVWHGRAGAPARRRGARGDRAASPTSTRGRGCASSASRSDGSAAERRSPSARGGRARPLLPRAGRDARSAPRGGRRRRRRLPRRPGSGSSSSPATTA